MNSSEALIEPFEVTLAVATTALGVMLDFLPVSTVEAASVWESDDCELAAKDWEFAAVVAVDWFCTVPHAVRLAVKMAIINNAVNFFNIMITSVWDIQYLV